MSNLAFVAKFAFGSQNFSDFQMFLKVSRDRQLRGKPPHNLVPPPFRAFPHWPKVSSSSFARTCRPGRAFMSPDVANSWYITTSLPYIEVFFPNTPGAATSFCLFFLLRRFGPKSAPRAVRSGLVQRLPLKPANLSGCVPVKSRWMTWQPMCCWGTSIRLSQSCLESSRIGAGCQLLGKMLGKKVGKKRWDWVKSSLFAFWSCWGGHGHGFTFSPGRRVLTKDGGGEVLEKIFGVSWFSDWI